METPKPTPEHDWLQRLVGRWTFEADCVMGPDQPPMKTRGTSNVRALGGLWVIADGEGTSPDGDAHHSVLTVGYDPATGRFTGTFIASMMTKLWIYDGAFDGDGRLVLAATGPSFAGEGEALYHDIVEIVNDGHFRFLSRLQGPDGAWAEFMTADYRRAA
ncbi:DUF1579 domain-containing protein [Methylopila sp. M107]|uniref:DUF1579 domain-containing protein n=1 Tax=Methylopila sp. M107 TaxID=1101190 RepID=UPI00037DF70A|nr:DUF1579 domain-containing protein [Methylopila sp. M107]